MNNTVPWRLRNDFHPVINNGRLLLQAFDLDKSLVAGMWFFLAMLMTIPLGMVAGSGYPIVVVLLIVVSALYAGLLARRVLPAVQSAREELNIKNTPVIEVDPGPFSGEAIPSSVELSKRLADIEWRLRVIMQSLVLRFCALQPTMGR